MKLDLEKRLKKTVSVKRHTKEKGKTAKKKQEKIKKTVLKSFPTMKKVKNL